MALNTEEPRYWDCLDFVYPPGDDSSVIGLCTNPHPLISQSGVGGCDLLDAQFVDNFDNDTLFQLFDTNVINTDSIDWPVHELLLRGGGWNESDDGHNNNFEDDMIQPLKRRRLWRPDPLPESLVPEIQHKTMEATNGPTFPSIVSSLPVVPRDSYQQLHFPPFRLSQFEFGMALLSEPSMFRITNPLFPMRRLPDEMPKKSPWERLLEDTGFNTEWATSMRGQSSSYKNLVYPFTIVKPSRAHGDVTLQDINKMVMPTRIQSVGEQQITKTTLISSSSPPSAFSFISKLECEMEKHGSTIDKDQSFDQCYMDKRKLSTTTTCKPCREVIAFTKIHTQGHGTITIRKTRSSC